jgi:hypothetical protein
MKVEMKRRAPVLLLFGAVAGYAAGSVTAPGPVLRAVTGSSGRSGLSGFPGVLVTGQGRGREGQVAEPPAMPPVPNPPLYPDEANKPMYWSVDDLHKIYEARLAAFKANPNRGTQGGGGGATAGGPTFQGQRFRTHNIGSNFRAYYEQQIPGNLTGVMSHYDDVEQHEGVSDFYVITGGGGRIVVDGVIENREYRRGGGNSGNASVLLPGEFAGQPIRDGHTYSVKPGDWLAIPPNDPHWQLPTPAEGMAYLLLKVNIGIYPGSLSR